MSSIYDLVDKVVPLDDRRQARGGEEHVIRFKVRDWQRPLVNYFRTRRLAGLDAHASVIAHRRAGKDRVALFIEAEEMTHPGRAIEVWHCLPEYAQARKVVWDALTGDGQRLIDVAFPAALRKRTSNQEMLIELMTGSLWRLVGADNFNSLVGSNPHHVTFSEYALTRPQAREFVRPILAANKGTELTITTPRGYNHAFHRHEFAKKQSGWYAAFHPVSQTRLVGEEVLAEEKLTMPPELFEQEWECSFSATNVGSILGRRMERAEREGRVGEHVTWDTAMPVVLTSDIGFRDAAAFWFWQLKPDGYALIDYREESGLDADDWIELLKTDYDYDISVVWLPPDAKAKTYATKRSPLERFKASGLNVRVVPQTKVAHRINAARLVLPKCFFHSLNCARGIEVLRSWAYRWDEERRVFSSEPLHDEFSHGGDAFSYGALVLSTPEAQPAAAPAPRKIAAEQFSLDMLYDGREEG